MRLNRQNILLNQLPLLLLLKNLPFKLHIPLKKLLQLFLRNKRLKLLLPPGVPPRIAFIAPRLAPRPRLPSLPQQIDLFLQLIILLVLLLPLLLKRLDFFLVLVDQQLERLLVALLRDVSLHVVVDLLRALTEPQRRQRVVELREHLRRADNDERFGVPPQRGLQNLRQGRVSVRDVRLAWV